MSDLERSARLAWKTWGDLAKFTCCVGCEEQRYCRRARGGRRWLCLDCFDQDAAALRPVK